jgi:WD40 repeat protein
MQGEREEVNAKIDAIRTVVANYESGKLLTSQQSSPEKGRDPIKTNSFIHNNDENENNMIPASSSSSNLPSPSLRKPFKKAASEQKIKPIPQVQLDPSSIDYISKLINDKISKELSARDKRMIEHVHEIVNHSLAKLSVNNNNRHLLSVADDDMSYDSHHSHQHQQQPIPARRGSGVNSAKDHHRQPHSAKQSSKQESKIPRISLPKVSNPLNSMDKNKPSSSSSRKDGVSLPPVKGAAAGKGPGNPRHPAGAAIKEENLSMEGIQYSQCRSVVFPASTDIELLRNRQLIKGGKAVNMNVNPRLSLKHIFGYDGDYTRHGNLKGKNIVWLSDKEIAFPAAAVVVIMDIETEKQRFFIDHTDDVISLACFPSLSVVASSQIGTDCSILIWNYREDEPIASSLILPEGDKLRGINNLTFSPDGRLLLACGIEDSRVVYIYDWQKNNLLINTKTGHSDYCQFSFNSFCYESFLDESHRNFNKKASPQQQQEERILGSYSLTSFSNKVLKFWTFKQQYHPQIKGKAGGQKSNSTFSYVLEHSQGSMTTKRSIQNNSGEYTSCCYIGNHDPSQRNYVLIGMSNGSIQVWQHCYSVIDSPVKQLVWLPKGKLVLIIADVHDSSITEMDFTLNSDDTHPKLLTSDSNGIVNIWNVNLSSSSSSPSSKAIDSLPLDHLGAIQLDSTTARSISWNSFGNSIIIGSTNNAISTLTINTLSDLSLDFNLSSLLIAHNGKVRRITVHPLQDNYFATACSDCTIRIWDANRMIHIGCVYLDTQATAISFSTDGLCLAVGNEKGELLILYSKEFENLLALSRSHKDQSFVFEWKLVDSKSIASNSGKYSSLCFFVVIFIFSFVVSTFSGSSKSANKKVEITEIRYSPTEDIIAIGSKDGSIHVLSITNNYRHVAVCRGTTSQIKNLDFSIDGKVIKSTDGSRELLFWDVHSGQQITNSTIYRELQWNSFSCIYGWSLQGIFNRHDGEKLIQPDSEINCISRSPDGLILACGGSHTVKSAIKLFQYPTVPDSVPELYGGHTSPVLDVAFCGSDDNLHLISAGGNDSSVFLWDISYK